MIKIKRIYENSTESDGFRILVDRLWPRGISKEHAQIDLWLKEVTPSSNLRKWFSHDVEKWSNFQEKYREELMKKQKELAKIKTLEKEHDTVTLVFTTKDKRHTHVVVLLDVLKKFLDKK